MKRYFYPAFISLLAIALFSCGQSEEDRAVNALVRESVELVKLAEREWERKATEAEYLEREALSRLEQALLLYPVSPRAVRLQEGKTKIGPYTFSELAKKVVTQDRARTFSADQASRDSLADVLDLAGDLAGRPGSPYFQAGVLSRVAGAYFQRGENSLADEFFSRALLAAQSVEAPYYKVLALCELAGQYALVNREEAAGELLLEARELAEEIGYDFFYSGAAAMIASRYLENDQEEEAWEIIETIEEPYYRAWILLRAAGGLIKAGKTVDALNRLKQARLAAELVEDPDFRVEVITDCAGRSAQLGGEGAGELLEEAYRQSLALPDPVPRIGALARIASWLGKLDHRDEAEKILQEVTAEAGEIENNLFRDLVLMEIAQCRSGLGDYEQVENIVGLIEAPRFRGLTLAALSQHCLDNGDKEAAVKFAGQAQKATLPVVNPHFRADILIRISGCISPRLPVPSRPEALPPPAEEALTAPTP